MMLAGDGERVMAFGNVELVPEKVGAGPYAGRAGWLPKGHLMGGDSVAGIRLLMWSASQASSSLILKRRCAGHLRRAPPH